MLFQFILFVIAFIVLIFADRLYKSSERKDNAAEGA